MPSIFGSFMFAALTLATTNVFAVSPVDSGGGLPPSNPPPAQDFRYDCEAALFQQDGQTGLRGLRQSFSIKRADLDELGGDMSVDLKPAKWKRHPWASLSAKPLDAAIEHPVSFTYFGVTGEPHVEIWLQLQRGARDALPELRSSAKARAPFGAKELSVSTNLQIDLPVDGRTRSQSLTLSVDCKRVL